MRLLSQVLSDLIDYSVAVIAQRSMALGARFGDARGVLKSLAADVRHADSLPAENVRTTRAAMMMVIALEAYADSEREASSPWLMLAGATLPLLRGEAWRQLNNEREAREQGRDR